MNEWAGNKDVDCLTISNWLFLSIMSRIKLKKVIIMTSARIDFGFAKLTVKPIHSIFFGTKIRLSSLL